MTARPYLAEFVRCTLPGMDVPHYFTADQVQRLLDALAAHNRHQARTAALIMWRPGLRVSEVLELEWRDLDYSGEPPTLLVRKSKSRRARTVRLHADLVQLFANWPANRVPRDKVVALAMRTALRHIGDGIEWASLEQESPGTAGIGGVFPVGKGPVEKLFPRQLPQLKRRGNRNSGGRHAGGRLSCAVACGRQPVGARTGRDIKPPGSGTRYGS